MWMLTEVPLCPDHRTVALNEFYDSWKNDELVLLKWLGLNASTNLSGNSAEVDKLIAHPAFDIKNPNCCYAVFLG